MSMLSRLPSLLLVLFRSEQRKPSFEAMSTNVDCLLYLFWRTERKKSQGRSPINQHSLQREFVSPSLHPKQEKNRLTNEWRDPEPSIAEQLALPFQLEQRPNVNERLLHMRHLLELGSLKGEGNGIVPENGK